MFVYNVDDNWMDETGKNVYVVDTPEFVCR